jgi:UDP-N-acetyl-D-galactosamine dehydrogenase
MVGYHPQVILAGRRINDSMGKFIAEQTVKQLIQAGSYIKGAKINVMGVTFKENVPDLRNSKIADLVTELRAYGAEVFVHDPIADPIEAREEYGIELLPWAALPKAEAVIVAVAHRLLITKSLSSYLAKVRDNGCFIDVKAQFDDAALSRAGLRVWRL